MEHYISICKEQGTTCNVAVKAPLNECLAYICQPEHSQANKTDNFLLFPAYSHSEKEYPRWESQVDRFSVIVLDCDNHQCDPSIIDKFKERMKVYNYLIYETFSSTRECPKFRAIIPLDDELVWSKSAKKAIFERFKDIADFKASWFFSPDANHLDTVYEHDGIEYSASSLLEDINRIEDRRKFDEELHMLKSRISSWHYKGIKHNPEGWRNLPSVKKCLEGLHVGERDSSLYSACFAMKKLGYGESIQHFLDEVVCDNAIKDKFRRQYR